MYLIEWPVRVYSVFSHKKNLFIIITLQTGETLILVKSVPLNPSLYFSESWSCVLSVLPLWYRRCTHISCHQCSSIWSKNNRAQIKMNTKSWSTEQISKAWGGDILTSKLINVLQALSYYSWKSQKAISSSSLPVDLIMITALPLPEVIHRLGERMHAECRQFQMWL